MSERKRKINLFLHSIEYLIAFGLFFLFGIIHTLALEKTIYSGNNMGTLSSANTYRYGYMAGGVQQVTTASVNTTVTGVAIAFMFYYYEPVALNKTYTMTINFMDSDLLKVFNSSMVHTYSCNSDVCNPSSIVSVEKNNNYGNSNKLTITFNPTTAGTYIYTNLSNSASVTNLTGTTTFGIKNVTLDVVDNNQDIINNQTNNTNNIINNNNSNTQVIIDNQNQNTQQQIESQKVCQYVSKKDIKYDNIILTNSSEQQTNVGYGVTDYIKIDKTSTLKVISTFDITTSLSALCFYTKDKTRISCINNNTLTTPNMIITIPNSTDYVRFSIRKDRDIPQFEICKNGNQAISDDLNNLNDSINDDDIGGATQDGADFILDFDTNTFGLTSIITAPLNLIQSLTSSTCSELELPLPFLNNKKLKLPCMTTIYQNTFGSLFTMYQTITFGIIAYWVCVRIFNQVKDFKNPEHDEIEVVDL